MIPLRRPARWARWAHRVQSIFPVHPRPADALRRDAHHGAPRASLLLLILARTRVETTDDSRISVTFLRTADLRPPVPPYDIYNCIQVRAHTRSNDARLRFSPGLFRALSSLPAWGLLRDSFLRLCVATIYKTRRFGLSVGETCHGRTERTGEMWPRQRTRTRVGGRRVGRRREHAGQYLSRRYSQRSRICPPTPTTE